MKSVSLISLISLIGACHGHQQYLRFIPNGNHVPNPCTAVTNDVWHKVGHTQEPWQRPDILNPFGMHFNYILQHGIELGRVWEYLCNTDSDGDGRTNGQELGDIHCTWSVNGSQIRPVLSHPGIAEAYINGKFVPTVQAKQEYCR